MERVYLTREGYEKLAEELDLLKKTKRREISTAIEHARELGDLKENAEYHAAKEAMSHNEARISDLEDKLSRVEIIDDVKIDADKIFIGAKVQALDMDSNTIDEYMLVGPEEVDPMNGLISTTSPVGKAFLGHKIGDVIKIEVPAGILRYKIKGISR